VGERSSVFVGKLGPLATDESLAELFAHLGTVESARVNRYADKKTEGWG
jgi:RNA recognition motif-containing protein